MKNRLTLVLAAAALLGAASAAQAAADHGHSVATAGTAPAAAPAAALTGGEVRKVDAGQGKVTIRHEAITNLDMPAMTMVFRADKPELLKGLKPGDRVRFRAETAGGALIVTRIEPAK